MLHVNANHSAVVSDFPTSIKPAQSGRNTLAFTKGVTAPNVAKGRMLGEICNLILGSRLTRGVCAGRLIRAPQLKL